MKKFAAWLRLYLRGHTPCHKSRPTGKAAKRIAQLEQKINLLALVKNSLVTRKREEGIIVTYLSRYLVEVRTR